MRRRVGEAGKIEAAALLAVKPVREVHGAIQLLAGAEAGHQIQVEHVDGGAILPGIVEKALFRRGRAAVEVIIDEPGGLEIELVEREAVHDVQRLIRVAVVQLVDVRLEVGVANVVVDLRAYKHAPLLGRLEVMRHAGRRAIEIDLDRRRGSGGDGGNFDFLGPKAEVVLTTGEGLGEFLLADGDVRGAVVDALLERHDKLADFDQSPFGLFEENRRLEAKRFAGAGCAPRQGQRVVIQPADAEGDERDLVAARLQPRGLDRHDEVLLGHEHHVAFLAVAALLVVVANREKAGLVVDLDFHLPRSAGLVDEVENELILALRRRGQVKRDGVRLLRRLPVKADRAALVAGEVLGDDALANRVCELWALARRELDAEAVGLADRPDTFTRGVSG